MTKKFLLTTLLSFSLSSLNADSVWNYILPFTIKEVKETPLQACISNIRLGLGVYAGFTVGGKLADVTLDKKDNTILKRAPYQAVGMTLGAITSDISITRNYVLAAGAMAFTYKIGIPSYYGIKKGYGYFNLTVLQETANALKKTIYVSKNGEYLVGLEFVRQSQERSLILQATAEFLAPHIIASLSVARK